MLNNKPVDKSNNWVYVEFGAHISATFN